ncbi:MAG: YceI family protein [Vulcanimicrobiaceae bacterium]
MSVSTEQGTFTIDPAHSNVEFLVRHMMISKVRGRIAVRSGAIALGAGNLPASVEVELDPASIDTREPQRDAHLKSADFLDVERFPAMSFRSTAISGSEGNFTMEGQIAIHGVTRSIAFVGSFDGRLRDPWGNDRVAYSASGKLSRKDFGLVWNQALEAGGVMVGDEVELHVTVEATRPG